VTTAARTWLSRLDRFDRVGSTNDVVAGWLRDGVPEVCVAVADEQTAGRGRSGRTWQAPAGAALLCSLGFRPTYLEPAGQWRLAAVVSLAMAAAAEFAAGLPPGTVALKWPNDLVVAGPDHVRKLAGVLGETQGSGTEDPRTVVGIGVNTTWARHAFPAELADDMTSLLDLAPNAGGSADLTIALLGAFLDRLEPLVSELRAGTFPADLWRARQLTSGAVVRLERPDGSTETLRALDVDPESGALIVGSLSGDRPDRAVTAGEIRHLRFADGV
jgi:BirA family biotin operon repressor/biotin-[acetyl-CoA-carboxylase] ligase